eukprot:scaffold9874_cov62-Phaeocystis_antarctica.AAC.5
MLCWFDGTVYTRTGIERAAGEGEPQKARAAESLGGLDHGNPTFITKSCRISRSNIRHFSYFPRAPPGRRFISRAASAGSRVSENALELFALSRPKSPRTRTIIFYGGGGTAAAAAAAAVAA